jgi:hypothetical protein
MGMRKDFIRSEEEKQRRKKRPEEIRNLSPSQEVNEMDHVSSYL